MPEFIHVRTEKEYNTAASLFREYAAWLNIDLSFQKFTEELQDLQKMYAPPEGGIILSKNEQLFSGCIAIRKIDEVIAELKRMYVKPVFQHRGIGTGLLNEAILLAEKYGYKKIRLDTLSNMMTAISLYKQNGFYEIQPYYFNPENTAVYFEKILKT
ncbi:MAG: GNAT family N-acetyltransferase [Ferruginibacter sp.]